MGSFLAILLLSLVMDVASFYSNQESGDLTASGRPFVDTQPTCAHKQMPFGTLVLFVRGWRVTLAVVTDRGPFIDGRDWDLSLACAEQLDMVERGYDQVTAVRLCRLEPSLVTVFIKTLSVREGVIHGYRPGDRPDRDGSSGSRNDDRGVREERQEER